MSNEERDETMNSAPADAGEFETASDAGEHDAAVDGGEPAGAASGRETADLSALSRADLEAEIEVARAEIERLQDQSLRRQAELVNFRRRAQKELSEAAALGQGRLLELIVPVVDDFERAVQNPSADAETYHEGVEMILRRIHHTLETIGVERIEPNGQTFDPEQHEAIARHETKDVPEGQVVDVFQPGYRLRDRLIRPAAVVVAFNGDKESDAGPEPVADEQGADPGDE